MAKTRGKCGYCITADHHKCMGKTNPNGFDCTCAVCAVAAKPEPAPKVLDGLTFDEEWEQRFMGRWEIETAREAVEKAASEAQLAAAIASDADLEEIPVG